MKRRAQLCLGRGDGGGTGRNHLLRIHGQPSLHIAPILVDVPEAKQAHLEVVALTQQLLEHDLASLAVLDEA
jgi:hypothetical protein